MANTSYPLQKVRFPRADAQSFSKTLRTRVNQYFKDKSLNQKANSAMLMKTIAMLSFYFLPFIALFVAFLAEMAKGSG